MANTSQPRQQDTQKLIQQLNNGQLALAEETASQSLTIPMHSSCIISLLWL